MPKLKCEVEQCAYNYDWLCRKNYIDVDGVTSKTKKETCCKSYKVKDLDNYNYEFAQLGEMPRRQTEVYCDAINCVFERGQKCCADRIQIKNVSDVNNITDKNSAKSAQVTHCQTFECRE